METEDLFNSRHLHVVHQFERVILTAGISNVLAEFLTRRRAQGLKSPNELTMNRKPYVRPNIFLAASFELGKLLNVLPSYPLLLNSLAIMGGNCSNIGLPAGLGWEMAERKPAMTLA